MQIAYLGPEGTFCEQAARKYFPQTVEELIACPTINAVFQSVEEGVVVNGVAPVENSLEGSERRTLDLLLEKSLMIAGEVDLRIVHNLIIKPGTSIKSIHTVLSHPQALAQCRTFIEKQFPNIDLREVSSTAKAVQELSKLKNAAAIGTEVAAKRYGMKIVYKQIEDDPNNYTRFFILNKKDAVPTGSDKTSIIFSARDEPGTLYKVLEVFAIREINLTKIESRPYRGKPWKYVFYLDFEGHRNDQQCMEAMEAIKGRCIFVKVLGSYQRASNRN